MVYPLQNEHSDVPQSQQRSCYCYTGPAKTSLWCSHVSLRVCPMISLSSILRERQCYHPGGQDDLSRGRRSDWRTKVAAKASVSARGEDGARVYVRTCLESRPMNLFEFAYCLLRSIVTGLYTPPLFYIGWVGVRWHRHCKTCRSLRELDNQGTILFFLAIANSWLLSYIICAR